MIIDQDRAETVTAIVRCIGVKGIFCLEDLDPQFMAVSKVVEYQGVGAAALLGALNALASYRLTVKGEEWWSCWANFMKRRKVKRPREALEAELEFLDSCRGSIIMREKKKARIERAYRNARQAMERLWHEPSAILESGLWLTTALSRALRTQPWKKTIVFAAKMAYYAARTEEPDRPAPWDVDIPVDLRVSCFLYSTGIVRSASYRDIMRRQSQAQGVVRRIALDSNVPPLNLDTLFWRTGWIPRDLPPSEWCAAARETMSGCVGKSIVERFCGVFRVPCS